MFGTEDMPHLMDQGDDFEFQIVVRAAVVKDSADRHHYVTAQSLLAVADSIDSRPAGSLISADPFGSKSDDEIIIVISSFWKIVLKLGQ